MTNVEKEAVAQSIKQEGMWYCFDSYSDFLEIKDAEFHRLRRAFVNAGLALKDHLGEDE